MTLLIQFWSTVLTVIQSSHSEWTRNTSWGHKNLRGNPKRLGTINQTARSLGRELATNVYVGNMRRSQHQMRCFLATRFLIVLGGVMNKRQWAGGILIHKEQFRPRLKSWWMIPRQPAKQLALKKSTSWIYNLFMFNLDRIPHTL